jgi:signal peptide peptidase SppA
MSKMLQPDPIYVQMFKRWYILPDHLNQLNVLAGTMQSDKATPLAVSPRALRYRGDVAHVAVKGVLLPSVSEAMSARKWGIEATGYDEIRSMLAMAVSDEAVKTIVLEIDSPGGTVSGTIETADAIWDSRQRAGKAIVSLVGDDCCSAAYYMASQTDRIIAGPNSVIGCIGTLAILYDTSKLFEMFGVRPVLVKSGEFKGAGADGTPITEDQTKMYQPVIDGMAENFKRDVARGRGMTMDHIHSLATGAVWLSPEAKAHNLIDGVTRTNTWNGVSDMEITQQEKDKIASDSIHKERQRAADLNREFPNDPQFAQEQFAAGSSVVEAKAAYADKLKDKLAESQATQDALQAELTKARAANTTGGKTVAKKPAGCPPVEFGASGRSNAIPP